MTTEPFTPMIPAFQKFAGPRPTSLDRDVIEDAVSVVLPDFLAVTDGDEEDVADDLRKLAAEYDLHDSYKAARWLEAKGWCVDSTIVDLCDELACAMWGAHRRAIARWIKETGQSPKLAIGTAVRVQTHRNGKSAAEWFEGEIVNSYDDVGMYTIYVPALGHVRDGEGTLGQFDGLAVGAINLRVKAEIGCEAFGGCGIDAPLAVANGERGGGGKILFVAHVQGGALVQLRNGTIRFG